MTAPTTDALLEERGKTHGDFSVHARITQRIKLTIYEDPGVDQDKLGYVHCEAIDMIAHKLGRIAAGNPDFADHWDDIAGYARLVSQRIASGDTH